MSTQDQIQITYIPLDHIIPSPMNPRKHFDEASIQELADSISVEGVLQPILVREIDPLLPRYEIVAGERRYRASHMVAGMDTIPCIIRDIMPDEALEIMITENLQRQDISPMEEAVGFRHLMHFKHMDIREIAARMGKSQTFIAQRLKLNDLIPDIQKFFYDEHLLVKDAMDICMLPATAQQELYDDSMSNYNSPGDVFTLNKWVLSKYQSKLYTAPFDITDPELIKAMGPCTTCQFNTGSTAVLFPDILDRPVCTNSACFKQKCDLSFESQLRIAQEDPAVVLVSDEYHPSKETAALMKKLDGVMGYDTYDEVRRPEMPDRSDFENYNDSTQEDEEEFQKAMVRYNIEMETYQEKIASGKYLKAYIIGGSDKGHYTYIKLKKGKASSSSNGSTSKVAADDTSDIKAEIDRIRTREKRAIELDIAQNWSELVKLFNPIENIKELSGPLTQLEMTAAAHAIFNKLSFDGHDAYHDKYAMLIKVKGKRDTSSIDDYFATITYLGLEELIRYFVLDTLPPRVLYSSMTEDATIMTQVAEAYWPDKVAAIKASQKEATDKRAARVAKRIADLQKKIKEVKKEVAPKAPVVTKKTPAGRKAAVKGKGIKALIPILLLLLLTSCTLPADTITPTCTIATTSQVADRLHLQIHSTSAYVTLVRQSGRDMHIDSAYYRCISLSVDPSETITIIDGVEECQFITSPITPEL